MIDSDVSIQILPSNIPYTFLPTTQMNPSMVEVPLWYSSCNF